MFEVALMILGLAIGNTSLTVISLFNFAAGLVAVFFIFVCILIFIFVYDNMRKERKTTSPTV